LKILRDKEGTVSLDNLFGRPQVPLTTAEIKEWYHARREPRLREPEVQELLHLLHPRLIFIKTLPYKASVLDMGAGDGSLHILKKWPAPSRTDLRIYAYALEKGQYYDNLDGYELGRWPEAQPAFPGVAFSAVFCSHFLEHIPQRAEFIAWCAAKLPLDGRIYLEWPSPQALGLPSKDELATAGVNLIIGNYRDDLTHGDLPERETVLSYLVQAGFFIEQTGVIRFPFIEEELLAHFAHNDRDAFGRQSAFWSKTYWSQYIVAAKAR
jgi:hypothetical protein